MNCLKQTRVIAAFKGFDYKTYYEKIKHEFDH